MFSTMRSVLAFLAAPLPAVIILPLIFSRRLVLDSPVTMFLSVYLFFLVMQFVLGFPLRLVVARGERASLKVHMLIGIVMYGIPAGGFAAWAAAEIPHQNIRMLEGPLIFGVAGAVTGALYWLLAGIGSPAQRQRRRIAELDSQFD